jgi:hypothetical protein
MCKIPFLPLIVCVIIFANTPLYAQDQNNFGISRVGQLFDYWSDPKEMVVEGNYAYVVTSKTVLRVVDISDPSSAQEVGKFDLDGGFSYICKEGNRIYITTSVFNVSDPTSPEFIGVIPIRGGRAITVRDSIAFLGQFDGGTRGFRILNISDLDNPVSLGFYRLSEAPCEVLVSGNLAFCTLKSYGLGLYIFDISDLTRPSLLSNVEETNYNKAVKLWENLAYVVCGSNGLYIINVEDPENPEIIGHYDQSVGDVEINDTLAYIVGENGLRILDVSDPTEPTSIGFIEVEGINDPIAYVDGNIIAGNDDFRLSIIDVSDPTETSLLDPMENNGYIGSVTVEGNYAFILSYSKGTSFSGLMVVDVQDLQNPNLVGMLDNHHLFADLSERPKILESYVYISSRDSSGLHVIDIQDPSNPNEIGTFFSGQWLDDPIIHENLAYLSKDNGQVLVADISDPSNPTLQDTVYFQENSVSTEFVTGNTIVARDNYSITLWNIENPDSVELFSTIELYNIQNLALFGDQLYVIHENQDQSLRVLAVYDISEPSQPIRLGEYQSESLNYFGFSDMVAEENNVYTLGRYRGLYVMDVSDPRHQRMVGRFMTPGSCRNFAVQDGIAYVADTYSLGIYDCSEALPVHPESDIIPYPSTFILNPAYPNPFNSTTTITYGLDKSATTRLALYDLSGREVRTLFDGYKQAGFHSVNLNADDLSSGFYLVRLETAGFMATREIILLR